MAGIDFKSPVHKEKEDDAVVAHNTKIGVILFVVYVLFYAGFMGLSAFNPQIMSTPILGGMSIAIVYGFLLIVVAMALALAYMRLSKNSPQGGKQ